VAVSGNAVGDVSLLVGRTTGPTLLTGGASGLEGSLVSLAVLAVAVVLVVGRVRRTEAVRTGRRD
jgi:hypothetical protein